MHHERGRGFGAVDDNVSGEETVLGEILLAAVHSGTEAMEIRHCVLSGLLVSPPASASESQGGHITGLVLQ